ncbi:unnamed protein product, partial [Gulo gulo]
SADVSTAPSRASGYSLSAFGLLASLKRPGLYLRRWWVSVPSIRTSACTPCRGDEVSFSPLQPVG